MKEFMDQLLLFFYCFTIVFFRTPDYSYVLATCLTLIYVGVNNSLFKRKVNIVFGILILMAGFFVSDIFLFIPLILYNLLLTDNRIMGVLYLLIGISMLPNQNPTLISWYLLGAVMSAYMYYGTMHIKALHKELIRTRDDSTEHTELLREKNTALIDKQNYMVQNATLKERNRIAREIHDNVGHMLSRAILMTAALQTADQEEISKEPLKMLGETLNTAMNSIRESVHDLHDDSILLEQAVREITENFAFAPISLLYDIREEIPREVKYAFLAILKESLHNIEKHSNAKNVWVTMTEHPALYQMIVRDDGTVIEKQGDKGIGLTNMEDRIVSLNGTLHIYTEDGFRLFITIPKSGGKET